MTEYWWRSWHGAPMDHKWPVIAMKSGVKVGIVSAIAWALFDYASQQTDRGSIDGFDVEAYAVYTGFDELEINAVIKAMENKKVIVDGRLTAWNKRQQPKSETEIKRVTDWREKKRLESEKGKKLQDVTDCYDELHKTTLDTDTDTDTDTEKSREEEKIETTSAPPESTSWYDDFVLKVYSKVTTFVSIPGDTQKVFTDIEALRSKYQTPQNMIDYLQPFYQEWCTRRKSNGSFYSKSNHGWLDWALTGEIPEVANVKQPTKPKEAYTLADGTTIEA